MLALTWSLLRKQVGVRLQSPAICANPSWSLPSDSIISQERAAIRDNCKSNVKCALAAILLVTCLSVASCGGGTGATAGGGGGSGGNGGGGTGGVSITSISPDSAAAGSPDLTVTIQGSNFESMPGQIHMGVDWTMAGVSSTATIVAVLSSTKLTAVIPAALMAKPVKAEISVSKWHKADDTPLAVSNSLGFLVTSGKAGDPPGDPGSSPAVSISPASETLRTGGQRQFSGWDSTVGQYDVTWSLEEGAAAGTITADGLYTAPGSPGTFHLIATSSHNTSFSATAPLTIVSTGFASIGDMSVARSGHTGTLLTDGRVLVAGGTNDSIHSAELFDPATGSFEPVRGGMIHVRSGHSAAVLSNGKVLIAGGRDSNGNLVPIAELFDPATGTFSATGGLMQVRNNATATLLLGGKVLIAGGDDSQGNLLSTAELYDPETGAFTATGTMQSSRAQHTATLLTNGKVLLAGGNETSSAELFDPTTGLFTATGSLGHARTHHTATLLQSGMVLVLGGSHVMPPGGGGAPPAPVSLDSIEVYDPASGKFEIVGKLAVARDSHSATLLPGGTVLVAGGYVHGFDGDAQPSFETMFQAELIDPATFASTTATSLEQARAKHVATRLNNGQVLVTGGHVGFQELCCNPKPHISSLSSAELYE